MRCAKVQFSISHTRGCVAVAVAGRAVGIDVEGRRPIPDLVAVARTAFAPRASSADRPLRIACPNETVLQILDSRRSFHKGDR
jgi:phosphopantetheinyl transferase